jgi:hypothetical protein
MTRTPEYEAFLAAHGITPCISGMCIFGGPRGQHTNGGCRCIADVRDTGARILIQKMGMALAHAVEDPEDPAARLPRKDA